jgi:hypothetical protein
MFGSVSRLTLDGLSNKPVFIFSSDAFRSRTSPNKSAYRGNQDAVVLLLLAGVPLECSHEELLRRRNARG